MLSATFRLCLLWLRHALLLLVAIVAVSVAWVWKSGDRIALVPVNEWVSHSSYYSDNGATSYPDSFNGIVASLFKPSRCFPAGDAAYPIQIECNGAAPKTILQHLSEEPVSFRVGIFWIGKPEAIRLLNGTEAKRTAIRRKLVEDACP